MTPVDSNTFYQQVGARIRDARNLALINQETLATQLGLTRASIINLEKGRHRPSLFMLMEIANVLMCDYTSLVPVEIAPNTLNKNLHVDFSKSVSSEPLTKLSRASVEKLIRSIK